MNATITVLPMSKVINRDPNGLGAASSIPRWRKDIRRYNFTTQLAYGITRPKRLFYAHCQLHGNGIVM